MRDSLAGRTLNLSSPEDFPSLSGRNLGKVSVVVLFDNGLGCGVNRKETAERLLCP